MTPSDGQKVTWGGSGTTFFLTNPEGEDIVDVYFNNDGITTVTTFKVLMNGVALDIHGLMSLFAADSKITQRLVVPSGLSGNKQVQLSVHA